MTTIETGRATLRPDTDDAGADHGPAGGGAWVVEHDGRPVGVARLGARAELPGLLTAGWHVAEETGLAEEVLAALVTHARGHLGVPAVFTLVDRDDEQARKTAHATGFTEVGAHGRHRVLVSVPRRPTGVHHVELWVADLAAAERTFGWLFAQLGWHEHQRWPNGVSWRHGASYVVVEDSPARTGGGHERTAPGINHLALHAGARADVDRITAAAPEHGWRLLFADRHPHAGGPDHYAAYLENADGFEVELVAAAG